jgi:hypothetical protein
MAEPSATSASVRMPSGLSRNSRLKPDGGADRGGGQQTQDRIEVG